MNRTVTSILATLLLALAVPLWAADAMPAKPTSYVHDVAGVLDRSRAAQLNAQLEQFERDTSNQIVVAIFPKLPDGTAIEDYTQRVFDHWGVGQRDKNNGAVLFVFIQDRQMFIQVGYGLEGALPDATAKQIIESEIVPRFKAGDYTGGVSAATTAMMQATRGEYKGTGRTVGRREPQPIPGSAICILAALFLLFSLMGAFGRRRGVGYGGAGPFIVGGLLGSQLGRRHRGGWGGGGGFGGFGGGGGFGGLGGGGGMSGGGGAGGRW